MKEPMELQRTMLLIRRFEERLLNEFSSGSLSGTTHTYIGQEANAAGIFSIVRPGDIVLSNHRCHGHFLAYGGDPYPLAAEIMGKATGLVGGRGGSQHIHWKNFYTNGVQGGIVPIATGMAFAEKAKNTGNVVCVFLGDGTLGEGIVYESLNLASLWNLPVFFIVEDNRIAQTTPVSKALAGVMKDRFTAFGIPVWELETSDVLEVQNATGEAYAQIYENERPSCLLIHTYRFSAHSKGDDDRSPDEIRRIKEFDPLKINSLRLDAVVLERLEQEISTIVNNAFIRANADPFPSIQSEVEKNV